MAGLNYNRRTNRVIKTKGGSYGYVKFKTISLNSRLSFGKYIGLKVREVIKLDKDYLKWLLDNNTGRLKFSIEVINKIKE